MSKDIDPRNKEGLLNGYCEIYWDHSGLFWKGVMIDGDMYGYIESYKEDGSVHNYYTGYWINDVRVNSDNADGCCYIWCKEVV